VRGNNTLIQRLFQKTLLFGVFFIFFDQLIKFVWPQRVCNQGHILGFDFPMSDIFVYVILFWLFMYLIFSFKQRNNIFFLSIFLIFSGGFSNALDRVIYGCVRDIFPFFGWFFWNSADGLIVLGVCGIIIMAVFGKRINDKK
jgi:lipoprotein signal peptidase